MKLDDRGGAEGLHMEGGRATWTIRLSGEEVKALAHCLGKRWADSHMSDMQDDSRLRDTAICVIGRHLGLRARTLTAWASLCCAGAPRGAGGEPSSALP